VLRDQNGVFELCAALPIGSHCRPPVVKKFVFPFPQIDHRLDREDHTRFDLRSVLAAAVVENFRGHVKESADSVPAVCPDDAATILMCIPCDGTSDISNSTMRTNSGNTA